MTWKWTLLRKKNIHTVHTQNFNTTRTYQAYCARQVKHHKNVPSVLHKTGETPQEYTYQAYCTRQVKTPQRTYLSYYTRQVKYHKNVPSVLHKTGENTTTNVPIVLHKTGEIPQERA